MIVLIAAEKGGTGKTTIATNLAAIRAKEGGDVLLLDTDIQGSATMWSRTRDDRNIVPSIYCTQQFGRLDNEIRKLANKFEHIIIDAGGRDSDELRSSMLVSDRVYIPLQAGQFDVWTINSMATMVQQASTLNPNMEAFIVLNRASYNPSVAETEDAQEILSELESLKLSQVTIKDRIAFRKAARDGLAVTEMKIPDTKAISEITLLYKEIYNE